MSEMLAKIANFERRGKANTAFGSLQRVESGRVADVQRKRLAP